MKRPTLYFAYGSNLHPLRLGLRTPSARHMGVARLPGYRIAFHKRNDGDGSAKADAVATGEPNDELYGAVYQLAVEDHPVLDRYEGLGSGYELREARIDLDGSPRSAFLYVAQATHVAPDLLPWRWYRDLVVEGARWNGLATPVVARLTAVLCAPDPNPTRAAEHERLLAAMPGWRPEQGYRLS